MDENKSTNILDTNFAADYGVTIESPYRGDKDAENVPFFFKNTSVLISFLSREIDEWRKIEDQYHGNNLISNKFQFILDRVNEFFSNVEPSFYENQEGLIKDFNKAISGKNFANVRVLTVNTFAYIYAKDDCNEQVQLVTDSSRHPGLVKLINQKIGTQKIFLNLFLSFPILQQFQSESSQKIKNAYRMILKYNSDNALNLMKLFLSLYLQIPIENYATSYGAVNSSSYILTRHLPAEMKITMEDRIFVQQLYLYSKNLLIKAGTGLSPKIIAQENGLSSQLDDISGKADALIRGTADKITQASQKYNDDKNKITTSLQNQLEEGRNQVGSLLKEKNNDFDKLKQTYESDLKLKEPAAFWKDEAKKYSIWAVVYSVLSGCIGIAIVLGVGYMISLVFEDKNLTSSHIIPVFLIPALIISLSIYVLKTFINLAVSNTNYAMEFEQKRALTVYYLTMVHDGSVKNSDGEKEDDLACSVCPC